MIQAVTNNFLYDGDQMASIDSNALDYDKNGNMIMGVETTLVYNWDNKLCAALSAVEGSSISLKYDPDGNRIYKQSTISGQTTTRKYIIDRVGDLPTILSELDPAANYAIKKTYVYGNSQILMQHDGPYTAPKYFYLHDRLGNVRQVINSNGSVVCRYTYNPFGELHLTETEDNSALCNPFKYTGQYFDTETGLYYFINRIYDPYLNRFTSHDPIDGKFTEPLTLHKYLYCKNDPINLVDPTGKWASTRGISYNVTEGRGGGTITIQYFYGLSDDLTFFSGYMLTVALGPEPASGADLRGLREGLSHSFSGVLGYSPNAQSTEDLAGPMLEFGGSYGTGFSVGYNWAISPTGVTLRTAGFGMGIGGEGHGQGSYSFVFSDFSIGPSMHERQRSPIEQWLTDLIGW